MGSNAATGGSEDREEKKIPSYSKQFQTRYKVTKSGEVKKRLIKPIIAATPTGSALMSFADEQNYKRRLKFAEKKGLNLLSKSKEYVTSPAARSYLDEFGYAETLKDKTGINDKTRDRDSDNQVVQAPLATTMPVKGPTEVEVSQVAPEVTSEEARAKANELIRKKRRGVGRNMMIATSPQGVTDKSLTLSNKSLLG